MRFVVLLACALFLGQVTGVIASVEDECGEACQEDEGGLCSPLCNSCGCHSLSRAVVPAAPASSAPEPPVGTSLPYVIAALPSVDPAEILRVPIRVPAHG